MSLPHYIVAALPITFVLFLTTAWWDRHWKLRNLPTPVCLLVHVAHFRSESFLQAASSLVWGHEKYEFEDDQGSQLLTWFKECGAAFKIKAAWGYPEIVRKSGGSGLPPFSEDPNQAYAD